MKTQTVAILAVAIIVVAAVAIVVANGNDDSNSGYSDDVVTYHGNGGLANGMDSYTYVGTDIERCFFELKDKAFKEWNTKADGSGTTYSIGDKAPEGKLDLYAQWGWRLNYSGSFGVTSGLGYYMMDGQSTTKITSSSMALPDTGRCTVLIMGGHDWTLENKTFGGINSSSKKVSNIVDVSGATEFRLDIIDDTPCITFTYNGPVTISIADISAS